MQQTGAMSGLGFFMRPVRWRDTRPSVILDAMNPDHFVLTRWRACAALVMVCLCVSVTHAGSAAAGAFADHSPAFVKTLIRAGSSVLALRIIDLEQARQGEDWLKWERLRIDAYKTAGSWAALAARARSMPAKLSQAGQRYVLTEIALAELARGDGAAAMAHLRTLLWRTGGSREQRARWRRLVIRAYLVDGRVGDAHAALLKYQHDFRAHGDSWQLLRAQVLMRHGEYGRAYRLLADVRTDSARLARLYAGLVSKRYKPAQVLKQAGRLVANKRLDDHQRQAAWLVMSKAAMRGQNPALGIDYLEKALHEHAPVRHRGDVFYINGAMLWRAYLDLGARLGNGAGLVEGDDAGWLGAAEAATGKSSIAARALYATIAARAETRAARTIGHRRLAEMLVRLERGHTLRQLYLPGLQAPAPKLALEEAPDDMRYYLAIEALKAQDLALAARLMRDLKIAPVGEPVNDWLLRRARTLIFAGDTEPALRLLEQIIASEGDFTPAFSQRLMQVLFDLQEMDQHQAAHALMVPLYARLKNQRLERELLFWMAESQAALGAHKLAAELYLRSAYHGMPTGGDMWGQSARFHAAEMLAQAGFVEDARTVYGTLLRVSSDDKRRALLARKMQRLWLHRQAKP